MVTGIFFYNEMPVGEGAPVHSPVQNYVESGTDIVGDAAVLYNEYPKNISVNTLAMALPFVSGPMLRGLRHVISDGIFKYGAETVKLGEWVSNATTQNRGSGVHNMTESMEYQSKVTGAPPGWEFNRNGTLFDGIVTVNGAPTLIDTKYWRSGKGSLIDKIDNSWAQESILNDARKQLQAANGVPIQWHVVDDGAANTLNDFFGTNNIDIEVVHTPWQ